MTSALDEVRIEIECPRCGTAIIESYGFLKAYPFVQCDCGARINVDLRDSDVAKVDSLVAASGVITFENDN